MRKNSTLTRVIADVCLRGTALEIIRQIAVEVAIDVVTGANAGIDHIVMTNNLLIIQRVVTALADRTMSRRSS